MQKLYRFFFQKGRIRIRPIVKRFQIRPDTDPQHCIRISLKKVMRIRLCFKTAWACSIGKEELKEYPSECRSKTQMSSCVILPSAGFFKQSMRTIGTVKESRVVVSVRQAIHSMAELAPWNRFLGSLKVKKFGLLKLN